MSVSFSCASICELVIILLNGLIITEVTIASLQMKAVEKLISGTEIGLGELESRANQPHILKVCYELDRILLSVWSLQQLYILTEIILV